MFVSPAAGRRQEERAGWREAGQGHPQHLVWPRTGRVVGQGGDVAPSQGGTWECSTWFLCTKGNRGGQGGELT